MSMDPNITEEQQWAAWSKQHPNPSGLPDQGLEHEHHGATVFIHKRPAMLFATTPRHHAELDRKLKAKGLPGIAWHPSPNFTPGRAGHNPNWTAADPSTWITFHTMVGWMGNTIASFLSVARQASSTYAVGLDGSLVQFVHEEDAPWTNGTMAGVGSNLDSITIEGEDGGNYNGPRTPAFYEAYAELVANISSRRAIPLVHRGAGGGCLRHRECTGAQTSCPDSLEIDGIIARAVVINTTPPPDPTLEWKRNLKPNTQTFVLTKAVPIYSFNDGSAVGSVAPGTLAVAFETTVGGKAYWVTVYGSTHGNGVLKSDVTGAIDNRPEWTRNLATLPVPASFVLARAINIYSLETPRIIGTVPAGPLAVSHQTSVGGQPYWVTDYGVIHGDGVLKSEVEAAIVVPTPGPNPIPPEPPQPTPGPTPSPFPEPPSGGSWWTNLLQFLKDLFHF